VYLVFAINIQMLITGYGVGFSAPCLAQVADTYLSALTAIPS
jgi:hypothetical protein